MGKEKNFENAIKNYLEEIGAWYVKFFANGFTKTGVPDILANINGRFVGIEVKQEKGSPSLLQKYNLKDINDKKGVGILVYPSCFNELKQILKAIQLNPNTDFKAFINEEGYILLKKSAKRKTTKNS